MGTKVRKRRRTSPNPSFLLRRNLRNIESKANALDAAIRGISSKIAIKQRRRNPLHLFLLRQTKYRMCKAARKKNMNHDHFLFDPGSTKSFISLEMVQAIKLQADQLGVPMVAQSVFMGAQTHVTPVIGSYACNWETIMIVKNSSNEGSIWHTSLKV